MQALTLNLESNVAPIYVEEWKAKVLAYAKKLARTYEKKQEPKLSDFFGMFGSNPEDANKSYDELRAEIMKERFGI